MGTQHLMKMLPGRFHAFVLHVTPQGRNLHTACRHTVANVGSWLLRFRFPCLTLTYRGLFHPLPLSLSPYFVHATIFFFPLGYQDARWTGSSASTSWEGGTAEVLCTLANASPTAQQQRPSRTGMTNYGSGGRRVPYVGVGGIRLGVLGAAAQAEAAVLPRGGIRVLRRAVCDERGHGAVPHGSAFDTVSESQRGLHRFCDVTYSRPSRFVSSRVQGRERASDASRALVDMLALAPQGFGLACVCVCDNAVVEEICELFPV